MIYTTGAWDDLADQFGPEIEDTRPEPADVRAAREAIERGEASGIGADENSPVAHDGGPANEATAPVDDLAAWIDAYRNCSRNISEWTSARDEIRDRIVTRLTERGASIGTVDGRPVVRHTEVTQRRFNSTAFKKSCPDEYARYLVESSHRRLTVEDGA